MKKFFAVIISLFCLTAVFAEDWYVCLGSFTKKEYLDTYITALEKNKIPVFTQPYTDKKGVNWIRVFYDEGFKNADTARMIRDSLQPKKVFKDFKMDGLWICQTTKPGTETTPAVVQKAEPKVEEKKVEPVKTEPAPAKVEVKEEPAPAPAKTEKTKKTTSKKSTKSEPAKVETPAPVEPVVIEKSEKPVVEEKPAPAPVEPTVEEKAAPAKVETPAPVVIIIEDLSSELDAVLPFINGFELSQVKHYNFDVISKISPNYTVGEEVFIDDIKEIADSMVTARYKKSYSTIDVNICFSEEGFPEISFDGLEKIAVSLPGIDADCGYLAEDGNINTCYVMSSNNKVFYGICGKNMQRIQMLSTLAEIQGTKLVDKNTAVGSILVTSPKIDRVMYTYTDAVDIEDSFIVENPDWMDYISNNWYENSVIVDGYNIFYELGVDSDDAQALFENFLAGTEGEGTVKEVNGNKVWFFGSATTAQREAVFADGNTIFFIMTEASEEALLEEVSKR